MARRRHLAAAAAVLVAAGSTIACGTVALVIGAPETALSRWAGLAAASEARADSLVATDSRQREAMRVETLLTLEQAPATPRAWLRLTYLDSMEPAGLGVTGNRALAASYSVAPFGPDDTLWRLAFAFNHWEALDQANRLAALDELRVTSRRGSAAGLANRVSDPTGRLSLLLTEDQLRRERAAEAAQASGLTRAP